MSKYIKNWFSNMIPFEDPLVYRGITYHSVENFYQAHKSLDPKDHEYIASLTPFESKQAGQKLKIRPNWGDRVKWCFMRFALKHKFRLDTEFGKKLIETGDEEIIEWNNWGDQYWGKTLDGVGENHLGRILMEIRNELILAKKMID
jgi:ribA/ribD-fused uncharacterized protein